MRNYLIALLCSLAAAASADGTISTIAGASTLDGVAATSTLLNYPQGIATDGVGNVYISDTGNQRIRRVDAGTHIITTIAGTGVAGFTGDYGTAAEAQLNNPCGLSYVINGTNSFLYVADSGNNRIRRIDLATGIITTVAGTGVATYDGDQNLAIFSSLNSPKGLYADASGTIYIADTGNNRIRRVDGAAGSITTVAGNGAAGFAGDGSPSMSPTVQVSAPETCVVGNGLLYIADTGNNRIRSVNLSSGTINTYAGSGSYGYNASGGYVSASTAYFNYVHGLYVSNSYVFFCDSLNHRIRYTDGSGVYDWIGTGVAGYSGDGGIYSSATLNNPQALTVDSNYNVVFVDYSNNCVRKVLDTSPYHINTIAGSGIQDGVPGINVVLKDPESVIAGSGSNVLIGEVGANKVRSLDLSSGVISTFAGTGASAYFGDGGQASAANFFGVRALVRDPAAGDTYVADNYSYLLPNYTYTCFNFGFGTFCFNLPNGTFSTNGESRIRKINSLGVISTISGGTQLNNTGNGAAATAARLGLINGLAMSSTAGVTNLFLSDSYFHVLRRINLTSGVITALGGLSGTAGYAGDGGLVTAGAVRFSGPQGLATDAAGDLYIADTGNNAVRKVAAGSLSLTTICGQGPTHAGYSGDGGPAASAALFSPSGLWFDAAGNLFIADTGNDRIRRIDAISNSITTVVGNGFQGFSGDGGQALFATLNAPKGVYVDPQGSIYTADANNNRVRKVNFAPTPAPTPVVSGSGKVAAFPSPAEDRICFSYIAPSSGKVEIDVYNTAMQLVAKFEDSVSSGSALTCGSIRGLASGLYLYRLSGAGGSFSPNKFKVAH